jgi:hypothetical protein
LVQAKHAEQAGFVAFSAVANVNFYWGQRVQLTRAIEGTEYDGDWTVIVFEETDELPEIRAALLW